MSERPKDTLLLFGKTLATLLQWSCAVAGGVVLLILAGALLGIGGAASRTVTASPASVVAIAALLAGTLAALFFFFARLRAIIVSVGLGDPFTPENAARLQTMAWLFLGAKIMRVLIGGLRHHLLYLMGESKDAGFSLGLSVYDLDVIVIVLVLFILARIFRHGAAMREDLKGTV